MNSIYPGSHHSKISKEGEFTMTANEAAVSVVDHALLQHPCARPRGEFIWFDSKVSRRVDHFFKKSFTIFLSSDCGLGSRGSQGRNYDEKLSLSISESFYHKSSKRLIFDNYIFISVMILCLYIKNSFL